MANPIQSRTQLQIVESIGYGLNDMVLLTADTTTDTSSIIDAYGLAKGGDDEYNDHQVVAVNMTGSIVEGEKSFISDFDSTAKDATVSPVFTAAVTTADVFEMWKVFSREEVVDALNVAVMEVSDDCLQLKTNNAVFIDSDRKEYNVLSSFKALSKVEYVSCLGIDHTVDTCDTLWTAGSANVTVTLDTSFEKEGTGCVKAVEDGSSSTGAILAYHAITSMDLTDSDTIEFWMYSSIALTAGQLQIHLSSTAIIASAEETLDIPAMDAATWYRHSITMEAPASDGAIISVGIYQVADVGAFTFYVDDIHAVYSGSKAYKVLPPDLWDIVKASTPLLRLDSVAVELIGEPHQLRLTGYQLPALFTDDTTTSEIDPSWLINKVIGELMLNHAKSPQLDIDDREGKGTRRLQKAEYDKTKIRTQVSMNTRWIS